MELKIKTSKDNSLISREMLTKVYRENWNFNKSDGNYNSGENFFSIHWEVNYSNPYIIRFHVESPKFSIDPNLNDIKSRLVIDLKETIPELSKLLKNIKIKDSARSKNLINLQKNKCSEVFQIILDEDVKFETISSSIEKIDSLIGDIIDEQIKRYISELEDLGLDIKD